MISKKLFWLAFCGILVIFPDLKATEHFDTVGVLVAIDRHIISLRKGELEKAYRLTSFEFKHYTPLKEFIEFVEERPPLNDNQSIALGKLAIEFKVAHYEGILCSRTGEKMKVFYDLAKEGPDWKIQRMLLAPTSVAISPNENASVFCLKCRNSECKRGKTSLLKDFFCFLKNS